MELTLVNVVAFFLLANALFWGLGPHALHCKLIESVGVKCVPHYAHITLAVVFFVGTVMVIQRKYLSQYWAVLDF